MSVSGSAYRNQFYYGRRNSTVSGTVDWILARDLIQPDVSSTPIDKESEVSFENISKGGTA
jgi:hypothetical protein